MVKAAWIRHWTSQFFPCKSINFKQVLQKKLLYVVFLPHLLVSVLLALAPPPALRDPLDEEEPNESEDELLMLSLSWPLPQEDAAHPPLSGRRLSVGELSEVVSGALLSMLAMPEKAQNSRTNAQTRVTNNTNVIFCKIWNLYHVEFIKRKSTLSRCLQEYCVSVHSYPCASFSAVQVSPSSVIHRLHGHRVPSGWAPCPRA